MGNAPSFTLGGKSIVPFQYAFSTHGHNLSAAFRQRHSKCVFDTWRFLRQGLLQRNDVIDIITINKSSNHLNLPVWHRPLILWVTPPRLHSAASRLCHSNMRFQRMGTISRRHFVSAILNVSSTLGASYGKGCCSVTMS